MAKFRVGQEVTRKKSNPWKRTVKGKREGKSHPAFGKIYIVESNVFDRRINKWVVALVGFPDDYYSEDSFEAVVPTLTIEKELEQLTVEA